MNPVSLLMLLSSFVIPSYAHTIQHITDPNTGAQSWSLKQDGVVLYMNQLLPDQIKAFYSNRGFTQKQIKHYVNSCVFMTVLRNESAKGVIHYQSNEWSVKDTLKESNIKPVDDWLDEFKTLDVKKSALIAFRWAQFPIGQEYEPGGDWNQGMLSLGAQSNQFDVVARWKMNGKDFQINLEDMSCAQ